MKRTLPLWILLLSLLCVLSASAEEAPEITDQCTFTQSGKQIRDVSHILDRDYGTYCTILSGRALEAESQGEDIGGIFIQFHDRTVACTLEARVRGVWKKVADCGDYLTEWFSVPMYTDAVRLVNTGRSRMFINEFYVYGYGVQPARAAKWHTGEKCDLMLISCHPDDEVLWFGGLLPTYARERGYEVQVVVVVPSTPERRLELLDSLWHCGVTRYPRLLGIERHCFIYAIHRSGDQTFPLCQHTLQRPLQILSLEAGKAALRYIDAVVGYGHPVGKPDPAYLPERVSFRDFERGGLLPVCCNLAEADDAGARRSSLGKHLCREAVAIAIRGVRDGREDIRATSGRP